MGMFNWLELTSQPHEYLTYTKKVMGLNGCAQGKGQVTGSCFWKLCHCSREKMVFVWAKKSVEKKYVKMPSVLNINVSLSH